MLLCGSLFESTEAMCTLIVLPFCTNYIYRSFTISSGPHFKFSISVREGVLGLNFEFESTSEGSCWELFFEFESPLVNAGCALLLLFVEEAEAAAEAEAVADDADAAQKQGKRGEGFTCSNSHTRGKRKWGKRRRLVGAACTGAPRASSSQPRPLPLPLASSSSS